MDDVGSVCVAGRICCAIRVENKPRISSGDRSELIRKSMARAAGVTRDTLCKALRKDGDPAAEHPSGRDESAGTEDPCRRVSDRLETRPVDRRGAPSPKPSLRVQRLRCSVAPRSGRAKSARVRRLQV